MGQNVSGAGNQGKTIAELQTRIKELRKDGVTEAERNEILQLTSQISQALSGKTVQGGMVGLTLSKDGEHVNQTDAQIASPEQIAAQEKYQDKTYIKNELCHVPTDPNTGQPLTDEQFEALVKAKKEEFEAAKEKHENIEKELKKTNLGIARRKELMREEKDALKEKTRLSDEYERLNVYYRAQVKGKGLGDIQDASKNNVKYMTQVNDIVEVCLPGMKEETIAKYEGKVDESKIKELSDKNLKDLETLYVEAEIIIEDAQKALQAGELTEDQYKEIENYYGNYLKMFDDQGNPNTLAIKNVLVDYCGLDHKFNIDETKDLAKEIGSKDGEIKNLVKKFGFGVEGTFWKRMGAAAMAGGPALACNAISYLASGTKSVSVTKTKPEQYEYTAGFTKEQVEVAMGNSVIRETIITPNMETGTVVAQVTAEAVAKIPILGQVAGPVASGILAFFMCDPKTENVFNGTTIDAILANGDLSKVKGDENKLIIANIQEMQITGNKVFDDRIKAAVIQAAIGKNTTAANTEELLAAYEALKDTQAKIQEMIANPPKEEEVEVKPDPPKPEPPEPEPVKPTTTEVTGRGMAIDHALLNKRGVAVPTGFDPVTHRPTGPAQYVIAESQGELEVTGDNKREPETIIMHDNTNTKVNSYKYRKITQKEIEQGYLDDGKKTPIKMSEIAGRTGPFYVLESVEDDKGTLKTRHAEIYSLTVVENKTTEDDNDVVISYDYKLEQFEGDSGSGRSSMRYAQRAKR